MKEKNKDKESFGLQFFFILALYFYWGRQFFKDLILSHFCTESQKVTYGFSKITLAHLKEKNQGLGVFWITCFYFRPHISLQMT